jgi:hypothetical protein
MVVSTGPGAEGDMVLMTDTTSEGTVDLRGSGGVRVASESARVQVVGGGVEIAGVEIAGAGAGRVPCFLP